MNIKLDVNKALSEIAHGLGVAVDKIYPILYKQAIIEGIYNLISILFLIAVWVFIYRISKSSMKAAKKDYDKNSSNWSDNWIEHVFDKHLFGSIMGALYCIFVIVFGIASLIMIPDLIRDTITAFFNTDYYVIKEVIEKIK
jgi:Ca2+/Na+ antiporter